MREQFYNGFIVRLSNILDEDSLRIVAKELTIHMEDYEITKRATEVVPYDYSPECAKVYLVTRKIEGLAMSSLKLYQLRLRQFFNMVRIPLEKITANDVRIFCLSSKNNPNVQIELLMVLEL